MIKIINGSIKLSADGKRQLHINLDLKEGDFALLIGSNGSGKTTLLDIIAGVRTLESGKFIISQPEMPIAYAVQDANAGLLPWRNIKANIMLPSEIHHIQEFEQKKRVEDLLNSFHLLNRKDDYPYKLSGGEKQAINLIRALCTPCCIGLFDEILSSLHNDLRIIAKRELTEWIKGKTSIFVSHDPDDLNLPHTKFFMIKSGTVIETDQYTAKEALLNNV